jgi:hypothetical protein
VGTKARAEGADNPRRTVSNRQGRKQGARGHPNAVGASPQFLEPILRIEGRESNHKPIVLKFIPEVYFYKELSVDPQAQKQVNSIGKRYGFQTRHRASSY